jgi:hypothetical protein
MAWIALTWLLVAGRTEGCAWPLSDTLPLALPLPLRWPFSEFDGAWWLPLPFSSSASDDLSELKS